jgi:hypothetical protein
MSSVQDKSVMAFTLQLTTFEESPFVDKVHLGWLHITYPDKKKERVELAIVLRVYQNSAEKTQLACEVLNDWKPNFTIISNIVSLRETVDRLLEKDPGIIKITFSPRCAAFMQYLTGITSDYCLTEREQSKRELDEKEKTSLLTRELMIFALEPCPCLILLRPTLSSNCLKQGSERSASGLAMSRILIAHPTTLSSNLIARSRCQRASEDQCLKY